MFKEARIKLTAWYLLIIMGVSFSFSGVIYVGVSRELNRIENFQRTRIQGIIKGIPGSFTISPGPDMEAINQARVRIITILGLINLSILILSGVGGYVLAGITLDPIAEMIEEQKDFVSNASHELRTPLTSLMTEIEVALRDKNITFGESKKLLQSNLEEVKKMSALSNYLLKLNKFQNGKNLVEFKNVNFKSIVTKSVEKIAPIAASKNIKISQKFSDFSVRGNSEALEELVTILLDNAIKYSQKGKPIEVITKKNKTLVIKDHGVGISPKDLPHIFDRFYRAEVSRDKTKSEGYGLGLSIAKSIVDQHAALIKVDSKPNMGSTFTVIF